MALAENHMISLVLAKTRRKAPFLAAPYQGILVSRCNGSIPVGLESTPRPPRTRNSDLGPLGPQTRHRIRLGPSSTHVVHEVHHIYCVVVSSLYSFFFPSPQTLVPSAIEVGRAPSVLPNSLGEHRVSEVAPNATSVSLLHRIHMLLLYLFCTTTLYYINPSVTSLTVV